MMDDAFSAMSRSIVDGAPDAAAVLAQNAVRDGIPPLDAINLGFVPGMHYVGEQFAMRTMLLPDMMASAEAMRAAMGVLERELTQSGASRPNEGVVVLGTVKGDIHEIGKALVGTILTAHGFRVHDLGVDVPADRFAAHARELQADIVGLSALLTTTMKQQRTVVETLQREGMRSQVKVMVGGAPVTRAWAVEIGADGFGKDAISALALARSLMNGKRSVAAGQP